MRGAGPPPQDEKFQLQQFDEDGVRPFAMAIRLTPELLSDLKRAEAEGSACLMKFGVTPNGNVLKIGDEEFKFNSAPEDGGLCDIFEEQRRGEDGNGKLKEAGSVWRKLSVLRTLNASEKDRVKKRSVEAQQQQKSRKAIILDPTHSQKLTQNSSIAGDAMGRRPLMKPKVEPPRKKLKPNSPVRSPSRPSAPTAIQKLVVSTASAIASAKAAKDAKAALVASPELPAPNRTSSLPPPPPSGKAVAEESAAPSRSSLIPMDNTPSPATTTPDTAGLGKPGNTISASELRNCLIGLLTENPKGLTLKAVEKALGESTPYVKPEKKTIEKAIRAIASYHAPGKYILKEGVTYSKLSPNSGSSHDDAAADSPPLVDSPPLPDVADTSNHDQSSDGVRRSETGLLGDKPSSLHAPVAWKGSAIVPKHHENAVSRAIRKANENYQKSQPQSHPDHNTITLTTHAQHPESKVAKDDVKVDTEQISVGGGESGEIEITEGENHPDINEDSEIDSRRGGNESIPNSPKEKAKPANSVGSESSSSASSSDSDSESSDSGDSRSGTSGSDSDSDGSSSDSEDENMDEDVEIVSDDEDGDDPPQKPKSNDKKKASHQSKDAKRAKQKPPEKLVTQESEEIDIGSYDGAVHPEVDPGARANVVVENLDQDVADPDLEVDVISVGGADSPQELGSATPTSEQQAEEIKREVANISVSKNENTNSSDRPIARGSTSSAPKEEPALTGEVGTEKDISIGKSTEVHKHPSLSGTLKGRINSMAINRKNTPPNVSNKDSVKDSLTQSHTKPPTKDSPAQSLSPSRPETGTKSSLSSPALKKDAMESSPRRTKENASKRRVNSEARKSFSKDSKTESEELVDKLVEAPVRPRPRPGKSAEPNRMSKPVEPLHASNVGATPESAARVSRDGESSGLLGRDAEAEAPYNSSRPLRDGPWRHNPDAGLLGKPGKNVEYLGRPQGRETEGNVFSSRQLKNMRRASNEPEAARRSDSLNDSELWGKPTRDVDGATLGNDSEVMVNRLREGRKELTRQEGPKGSLSGSASGQTEKKGRESLDRESGEWRESTPGIEQLPGESRGRDSLRGDQLKSRAAIETSGASRPSQNSPAREKGRGTPKVGGDLRKPSPAKAGDLRKPSPVKSVADFRKPSPGTTAGDLRRPSPVRLAGDLRKPSSQKLAQYTQNIHVSRDVRGSTGFGKFPSSSQVEERSEGNSSRNGRAATDTFDRPMESRGVKRSLEEGSNEPTRAYKKPSIAPVAPPSSANRGNSDLGAVKSTEKKQASPDLAYKSQNPETGRGGSSDGLTQLAGPSGKAPSGENGRKQRPMGKGHKASAKEVLEPPRGRDWKSKTSAGLLGPGGDKKKDNLQSDLGLSNGKRLKTSSSPEEVSRKQYFAQYEKVTPDLRGPVRSNEEAEAYRKEYQTKYSVYLRLHKDLEKNKENFLSFKREMVQHPDKLQQISSKVRREFHAIRKEFKRMQKTFDILHEELQTIKQQLRNFTEKAGQG